MAFMSPKLASKPPTVENAPHLSSEYPMLVYTTGYGGDKTRSTTVGKIGALITMIDRFNLVLIDIRFAPRSIAPCWRQHSLEKLLGAERYRWVQDLGNINYNKAEEIAIRDLNHGLFQMAQIAAETGRTPLLMCACDVLEGCHRRAIVDELLSIPGLFIVREVEYWDADLERLPVLLLGGEDDV